MTATFDRALEHVMRRKLCAHEAAHAAAALLLGLDVVEATAGRHTLEDLEHGDPHDPAGQVVVARDRDDRDAQRKLAITVVMGRLEDGKPDWPPRWPMTLAPEYGDHADLVDAVRDLGLDQAGYAALVANAYELWRSPEYDRLHAALSHALERHDRLDRDALEQIKTIATRGNDMEHAIKTATVETVADKGEFTAIAAAYSVDRQNDEIIRGAFRDTIDQWRASGKRIPLHWNHEGSAANIIGSVDPASMRETAHGLQVSGNLDLDSSDVAREAWRSMKNGSMSLSFGYIVSKSRRRSDGINELHAIDLFEISIVPAPANRDTRVLAMKSMDDTEFDRVRDQARSDMVERIAAYMAPHAATTLREKSQRIAREHAPIQVERFVC